MQKISVDKIYLEKFISSLKDDFDKLTGKETKNLWFKKFKEYFCEDKLFINLNWRINIDLGKVTKCKKIKNLKKIYWNIASSNSWFYKKIREFIIENFIEKIKNCPYCGKVPLIFYEKWKDKSNSYGRLFQFDHFFPKNEFHKVIINFYNLIPSCNACNHLKSDSNPLALLKKWKNIFHPYFWWICKNWNILKCNNNSFDSKVSFTTKDKKRDLIFETPHSKFFKLENIYLNSQDTFNIFDFVYDKYTQIKEEMGRMSKSSEDLIDTFLKNYYPENEDEILKYSNWKFKKDIVNAMKNYLK